MFLFWRHCMFSLSQELSFVYYTDEYFACVFFKVMVWLRQLLVGLLLQRSIFDQMGYMAKWQGIGFFPSTLVFPCQCFILIIHLKTALIRMTSMQSLSAFKQGCAFLEIVDHCKERQSLFFCVCERVEFQNIPLF